MDRMVADVFHLHAAVFVAAVLGTARIAVFSLEGIPLRPGVKRYDVDRLAVLLDARPARSVRHHAVGFRADDTFDVLDRVFRRDHLRVIVAVSAHIPVFVAVTGGQFAPVPDQITVGDIHLVGRAGLVDRLRLAPDADVRIVRPDPLHELVVVVALPGPHSVLNVPVQQAHVVFRVLRVFPGMNADRSEHRRKKQHAAKSEQGGFHRLSFF